MHNNRPTTLILSATLVTAFAFGNPTLAQQALDASTQPNSVIGKTVKHRQTGDEVGVIHELILSDGGRIIGVVIKTGHRLGLGEQDVSLSWDNVEYTMEDNESVFYVDINEETLRGVPEQ